MGPFLLLFLSINSLEQPSSTAYTPWDVSLMYKLRKAAAKSGKKTLFIAGGHSATISCKDWLENGMDLVLLGQCELTILKVI